MKCLNLHQRRMAATGMAALLLGALALPPALAAAGNTIWTAAGTAVSGNTGDGGQAREAEIDEPRSVFSVNGGYVFAEPWSDRVRKVGSDGIVATIAGTGVAGFSGDGGPATAAQVNFVHSAAPMSNGAYLLADTLNNRIRKVSPTGVITTVAGTGTPGYSGDGGRATAAQINGPRGVVALPNNGGFLFPDSSNQRVRKVSSTGTITTVAGTGVQGFSGDGGAATAAQLSLPFGVAPTPDGGFLIVDAANQRIRKVSSTGTITTVAGNGTQGFGGDGGPATAAELNNPHNVAVRPDGSFLIADASNERVRVVAPDGTISTLTGTGVRGYTGDGGSAAGAQISVPKAVAVTPSGDVLIAEEQNNVIRFVGSPVAPAATSTPPAISGLAQQDQALTAFPGGWSGTGPVIAYQWRRCDSGGANCVAIAGARGKTYTAVAADVGSTLRVQVTAGNSAGSSSAVSAQTAVVTPPGTATFVVAASGDDGDVTVTAAQSAGYPPSGTPAANTTGGVFTAGRRLTAWGTYDINDGLLRFDTSALPDNATITGATLRLYVTGKADADKRNVVADWYSAWPIDAADWTATPANGAVAGVAVSSLVVGAANDFPLQNLSNVSATGYTGLRLHVDGGAPAGDNYVQFASFDNASNPRPQLIITYSGGSAPTSGGSAPTSLAADSGGAPPVPAAGAPGLVAPSALTASDAGPVANQYVDLAWTYSSTAQTPFVIERSTDRTFRSGVIRTRLGGNATSYRDRTVQAATLYYYRVFAVSPDELRSPQSNIATVTTR